LTADQQSAVDAWLRSVLWENVLPGHKPGTGPTFEIHRLKGRFHLRGGREKIIQGVREIFDIFDSPSPQHVSDSPQPGKLILIGRHLEDFDFQRSLEDAIRVAPSA
jgi:hypothetical protein